jgi:hypothetical protein
LEYNKPNLLVFSNSVYLSAGKSHYRIMNLCQYQYYWLFGEVLLRLVPRAVEVAESSITTIGIVVSIFSGVFARVPYLKKSLDMRI